MKVKSSIHLAPGASGYLSHNSRQSYSQSQVFYDEKNEFWNDKKEAFKIYKSELTARSEAYTNRTKQKLQKNAITHYSAIVNLHKNHTLTDLKELRNFLEKSLDTKIFQVAIHRDEGKLIHEKTGLKLVSGEDFFCNQKDKKLYFDEKFEKPINMSNWVIEKNYHAHVEMMGIDSDGKAIKRNRLTRTFLKELQTFTAKSLNMERGNKIEPYTKEQMTEIKNLLKPKNEYPSSRAYGIAFNKAAKELGYFKKKTKRIDTHEFKQRAKATNDIEKENIIKKQKLIKQANAKISDVKKQAQVLRRELAALDKKLLREDWARYEAEVKVLKLKTKQKELTVPELDKRIAILRNIYLAPVLEQNQKLKEENGQYKEDRRDEHQRTLKSINSTTERLSEPTKADIRGATQAYKTKQTARANAQIASRISNNFIQFHTEFERSTREITDNLYIKKINQLKTSKSKITLDDVKKFKIKVNNKNTTIDEFIQKLKAENKELKAPKSREVKEVLNDLSEHTGINSNKLFDLVDQEIKKQNKPLNIKIESTVIDYENFDVALVSGEWLSKDELTELTEPTEQELKAIKDEGFSQSIDLISKKLSKMIKNLNTFISNEWKKLKIQKTSENPPIDKKTARVTSSRYKR